MLIFGRKFMKNLKGKAPIAFCPGISEADLTQPNIK